MKDDGAAGEALIKQTGNDRIKFYINATYRMNTGELSGEVPLSGNAGCFSSPVIAADSTHLSSAAPTAADDKAEQAEPAECPIKNIDGKTYCFQNDPALTKRQGGG
jgi:hypothetical protein